MAESRSASPPTERVIAVVELLASDSGHPHTASEIAQSLGVSRSTITAVLSGLTSAGWLERQPDKTYTLGWGLTGVADAVRTRLSILAAARHELQAITDETGYGCALSRVTESTVEFLVLTGGPERLPPGVRAGARLSVHPPAGAGFVAFRPELERERWLSVVPESTRGHLREVLSAIRDTGLGIWRLEENHVELFRLLTEVSSVLTASPDQRALSSRISDLLISLGTRGYLPEDVEREDTLSISYLVAPILDSHGYPAYELEVGLLRPDVSSSEVKECMERTKAAAATLATCLP